MANHQNPQLGTAYATFVAEMHARMDDLAVGLDPAVATVTNPPANSVRWSSAASKWQKWNGASWVDLVATYAISISGNAATATALQTGRTINGVAFNGTGNITVTANTGTSLTFINDGTGAASGTTFNGGTARIISYNTVGAPSVSGTNATGTWGISITGNAATASSLPNGSTVGGTIGGNATFSGNLTFSGTTTFSGPATYTGVQSMTSAAAGKVGSATAQGALRVTAPLVGGVVTSQAAVMSFVRDTTYVLNAGLDSDNIWRVGGGTDGADVYRYTADAAGNLVARGNLTASGTGFVQLANGTTAQRPGLPAVGMARWNATLGFVEAWNGLTWAPVGAGFALVTFQASFTLALNQNGLYLQHNHATAHTVTVPANASVPLPLGYTVTIDNDTGMGVVSIALAPGVTMVWAGVGAKTSAALAADGQLALVKIGTDKWKLSGAGLS